MFLPLNWGWIWAPWLKTLKFNFFNFWCRPVLRCWHSWQVWTSVGDRRWHSLDWNPFGWNICDLNERNTMPNMAFISSVIWFQLLILISFHRFRRYLGRIRKKLTCTFHLLSSLSFLKDFGKVADLCEAKGLAGLFAFRIVPHIGKAICLPNCASDIYIYIYIYILSYTSMYEANHLVWG